MTVLDVIQRSTDFLQNRGVESPRLQVELMLGQLLAMPRLKLYLNFERVLSESEVCVLRDWVKRRSQREPLQHILGTAPFCGLEIKVNRCVLVPRPETELLAEQAWTFLKRRPHPQRLIDFGTGSGCIILAVLKNCPEAHGIGLDVSPEALKIAEKNAISAGIATSITWMQGERLPDQESVDLIVSNPPYIPTAEIETLQSEVRDFDPRIALDGGPDGLNFYRYLAEQGSSCLKSEGQIFLEFGDGQAEPVSELFRKQRWTVLGVIKDYTARPRILVATPNQ